MHDIGCTNASEFLLCVVLVVVFVASITFLAPSSPEAGTSATCTSTCTVGVSVKQQKEEEEEIETKTATTPSTNTSGMFAYGKDQVGLPSDSSEDRDVVLPTGCPFHHTTSDGTSDGDHRRSLSMEHDFYTTSLDGNNNESPDAATATRYARRHTISSKIDLSTASTDLSSCPVFTGACQKNANLMRSVGNNSGVYEFSECKEGESISVKYSYSSQNKEFPYEIQESKLFNHGNTAEGYFSPEHGFLIPNYDDALGALCQSRGHIWVTLGKRMNGLMTNNGMIKAVGELEIVPGDERACPDESLQIACSILAQLTHGYRAACWRNKTAYEPAPALQIPWKQICQRLGRKDEYFAAEDFMYNCRPVRGNAFHIDNLEVLTPIWKSSAELIMHKLFCASNHHLKNMMPDILALARGEWQAEHIHTIIQEISCLTKMMGKAIPDGSAGENSIDPVEFATAFSNATSPLKEGVPALSGGGCPIFVCLDHLIGRQSWDSVMGKDLLMQVEFMPKNWRRFIEFLRQKRLFEKVPDDLQYLWALLKDCYSGDRGWLGQHKYRAYQFVELSGALGRASNKGSSSGAGTIRMLEQARQERDPRFSSDRSSYKTCLFKGKICSVIQVSEDRLTQLVTIESFKPLFFGVGDHVAIVMSNDDDTIWRFSVQHNLNLQAVLSNQDGSLTAAWKERLDFDKLEYTVYNVLLCARLASGRKNTQVILTVENLCSVLYPEEPRLYSFATINPTNQGKDECVTRFDLLVTKTGPGGCSAFLFNSVGKEVSFGLSTASKFGIPHDTTRPVVAIAAGSGIGTYLPMLLNNEIRNPKYAFLAFRTECTVPYLGSHLKDAIAYNKLKLFVELSREDKTLVTFNRKLHCRQTSKRYIDKLMWEQAALLRELAAPIVDGGMEASFYVCGNNQFFSTVRDSLEQIESGMVAGLVESSRLHLEVQARGGVDGKTSAQPIQLAEMCFHNKVNDFWTAIHGTVYDLTDYLPWHPGGRKILHYIAGTDCTEQWDLVSHNQDRMVYSQLSAYEVGPFESDRSALNMFLEFITRTENCVELYQEEDDLFDNLCDSYGKVEKMLESIFGSELLDLSFELLDATIRRRVIQRIWFVMHGREREIANRMYKVAPMKRSKEQANLLSHLSSKEVLRFANIDERTRLKTRLIKASAAFFLWCKQAVADLVMLGTNRTEDHCARMFYRLVMSIEHFYSSLAQPLPLESIRKWDVVRSEVIFRRTLLLRFQQEVKRKDGNFALFLAMDPTEADLPEYKEEILEQWQVDATLGSRVDMGKSTNLISDWFGHESLLDLFERLDRDDDGLIAQKDMDQLYPELDELELEILANFEKTDVFQMRDTYTFADFLESIPEVAQRNRVHRISSMMFKGNRVETSNYEI